MFNSFKQTPLNQNLNQEKLNGYADESGNQFLPTSSPIADQKILRINKILQKNFIMDVQDSNNEDLLLQNGAKDFSFAEKKMEGLHERTFCHEDDLNEIHFCNFYENQKTLSAEGQINLKLDLNQKSKTLNLEKSTNASKQFENLFPNEFFENFFRKQFELSETSLSQKSLEVQSRKIHEANEIGNPFYDFDSISQEAKSQSEDFNIYGQKAFGIEKNFEFHCDNLQENSFTALKISKLSNKNEFIDEFTINSPNNLKKNLSKTLSENNLGINFNDSNPSLFKNNIINAQITKNQFSKESLNQQIDQPHTFLPLNCFFEKNTENCFQKISQCLPNDYLASIQLSEENIQDFDKLKNLKKQNSLTKSDKNTPILNEKNSSSKYNLENKRLTSEKYNQDFLSFNNFDQIIFQCPNKFEASIIKANEKLLAFLASHQFFTLKIAFNILKKLNFSTSHKTILRMKPLLSTLNRIFTLNFLNILRLKNTKKIFMSENFLILCLKYFKRHIFRAFKTFAQRATKKKSKIKQIKILITTLENIIHMRLMDSLIICNEVAIKNKSKKILESKSPTLLNESNKILSKENSENQKYQNHEYLHKLVSQNEKMNSENGFEGEFQQDRIVIKRTTFSNKDDFSVINQLSLISYDNNFLQPDQNFTPKTLYKPINQKFEVYNYNKNFQPDKICSSSSNYQKLHRAFGSSPGKIKQQNSNEETSNAKFCRQGYATIKINEKSLSSLSDNSNLSQQALKNIPRLTQIEDQFARWALKSSEDKISSENELMASIVKIMKGVTDYIRAISNKNLSAKNQNFENEILLKIQHILIILQQSEISQMTETISIHKLLQQLISELKSQNAFKNVSHNQPCLDSSQENSFSCILVEESYSKSKSLNNRYKKQRVSFDCSDTNIKNMRSIKKTVDQISNRLEKNNEFELISLMNEIQLHEIDDNFQPQKAKLLQVEEKNTFPEIFIKENGSQNKNNRRKMQITPEKIQAQEFSQSKIISQKSIYNISISLELQNFAVFVNFVLLRKFKKNKINFFTSLKSFFAHQQSFEKCQFIFCKLLTKSKVKSFKNFVYSYKYWRTLLFETFFHMAKNYKILLRSILRFLNRKNHKPELLKRFLDGDRKQLVTHSQNLEHFGSVVSYKKGNMTVDHIDDCIGVDEGNLKEFEILDNSEAFDDQDFFYLTLEEEYFQKISMVSASKRLKFKNQMYLKKENK